MKYTVEGFSQSMLCELGLGLIEAHLLRWLVDFSAAGRMREYVRADGKRLYWVKYSGVIADLPILGIQDKEALADRMKRLVKAKVLIHERVMDAGTFSYYGFGEAYESLISDTAEAAPPVSQPDPLRFANRTPPVEQPDPSGQPTGPNDSSTTTPLPEDPMKIRKFPKTSAAAEYPPEFETWWAAYPRKKTKKAAYAKWVATLKKGATEADLHRAAENYAAECERQGTAEMYTKHPATFLGSAEPWRDYLGDGLINDILEEAEVMLFGRR